MTRVVSACLSCLYNEGGVCLQRNSAYPVSFVCSKYMQRVTRLVTNTKGDNLTRKQRKAALLEANNKAKEAPVQTVFKAVAKDGKTVTYYAYLPVEKTE